jgi:hypothetical protein
MENAIVKTQSSFRSSLATPAVETTPQTTTPRPSLLALSDEIKLMVLSEYLPTNKFFVRRDFENKQHETLDFTRQVLPLLIAIPELKYMVYDVLLKQNKVLITTSYRGYISHPPPWVNALVTKLCVRVQMTKKGVHFLRQLATGTLGFEKLVDIDIRLTDAIIRVISLEVSLRRRRHEPRVSELKLALSNMGSMVFPTKTLTVSYEYADNVVYKDSCRGVSRRARVLDEHANILLSKIRLINGRTNEDLLESYSCYGNRNRSMIKGEEDTMWPHASDLVFFDNTHVLQMTMK